MRVMRRAARGLLLALDTVAMVIVGLVIGYALLAAGAQIVEVCGG